MIKFFSRQLLFFGLLSISFSVFGINDANPQNVQTPETELSEIMDKFHAVGLSVAVVKNGSIIYTNSFGLKNIEKNVPLKDHELFRIASISKSFSATSIMQLVEAGKVSLNDDFSNLIGFKIRNPKYPNTVITLKMVLSHTSSINDKEGYFDFDSINPFKNSNWQNCYNNYEPGKGYEYCNLNYNMVGAVIEKLSGTRFDNYIKYKILEPLGIYGGYCVDSLDNSRFVTLYNYNPEVKKFVASPGAYAPRSEEFKNYTMGYSTPLFSPTGGMKISAVDLAKYMAMHMNKGKYEGIEVISKESAEMMQTAVSGGYGLALHTSNNLIPGKTMIGHTGSAYGLYSAMFFNPDEKFGMVVITNGCDLSETDGLNPLLHAAINSLYTSFIK